MWDTTSWDNLNWKDGRVPDPRTKDNVLLTIPVNAPTVWLDPSCHHCLKLDAVLNGENGPVDEHHLGFYKQYADKDDFHIKDRPFPHVFTTHAGVAELTPNAIVNMFVHMADLDVDVEMQVETSADMGKLTRPTKKTQLMTAGGAACHTKA